MSVDRKTVIKVAHLARLALDEARVQALTDELNNIIDWIEQLDEVDTAGAAPMTSVVEAKLHWRQDAVTDGDRAEDVLANAPDPEYGFYAVPKVIE